MERFEAFARDVYSVSSGPSLLRAFAAHLLRAVGVGGARRARSPVAKFVRCAVSLRRPRFLVFALKSALHGGALARHGRPAGNERGRASLGIHRDQASAQHPPLPCTPPRLTLRSIGALRHLVVGGFCAPHSGVPACEVGPAWVLKPTRADRRRPPPHTHRPSCAASDRCTPLARDVSLICGGRCDPPHVHRVRLCVYGRRRARLALLSIARCWWPRCCNCNQGTVVAARTLPLYLSYKSGQL